MIEYLDKFLLWFATMVPLSMSPGPANIAMANLGSRFKFKQSTGFLLGLLLMLFIYNILVGCSLGFLLSRWQNVIHAIEIIGCCYMLYLAWILSKAQVANNGKDFRLGFKSGFTLQALNPKIITALMAVFPVIMDEQQHQGAQIAIISSLNFTLATISYVSWFHFGAFMKKTMQGSYSWIPRVVFSGSLAAVSLIMLYKTINHLL